MTDIYQYEKKKDEQTTIKPDTGRRTKDQYVENLREGDAINDFFAIKIKKPLRAYKRGTFFEFIATDKTGSIPVKYWGSDNKDRVKRLQESFTQGDVVQLRGGAVESYDEHLQISINENTGGIRRCATNEYDITDFLPSLDPTRIKELQTTLETEIKNITNPSLRALLTKCFANSEFTHAYTHSPSAMAHHHNYVGGNLEHSIGVLRLCKNIVEMYPSLNHDLLVTGAILHDVGKLQEYSYHASIEKTDDGNFIGHIVLGIEWTRQRIQELRQAGTEFPEVIERHLLHLIASHHGRLEWGSPIVPNLVEACVLHNADLMDSQVKNYIQLIDEARKGTDESWAFIFDPDIGKKRPVFLGEY
jgi:3'-5' exoribonuclease